MEKKGPRIGLPRFSEIFLSLEFLRTNLKKRCNSWFPILHFELWPIMSSWAIRLQEFWNPIISRDKYGKLFCMGLGNLGVANLWSQPIRLQDFWNFSNTSKSWDIKLNFCIMLYIQRRCRSKQFFKKTCLHSRKVKCF